MNDENFDLRETLQVLEILMARMYRVSGRIYLDLRPNECFCLIRHQDEREKIFEKIIYTLKSFVRLGRLFGCTELNVLIDKHGETGGEPQVIPIGGRNFPKNCSDLPEVSGIQWIPVSAHEFRLHKKGAESVWDTLLEGKN